MRRRSTIPLLLAAALLLAGCGGGGGGVTQSAESTNKSDDVTVVAPEWAAPLLSKAGPEGAAIMAGSDFAAGRNRVTFLLVRDDNSLVRAPLADVYYQPLAGGPTKRIEARLMPIGVKASPAEKDDVKEIYEDNLPGNGVNRWVKEWKLPTEPWVFVVDRNGVVRDRFEGAISVAELEQSVRSNLLD